MYRWTIAALVLATASDARAEAIQVMVSDWTDNIYILNIHDSDGSNASGFPATASIGTGELEVARTVTSSGVAVCAKFRPSPTDEWNQICHTVSGSSGSVAWQDGFLLAMITLETDDVAPDAASSGGGIPYALHVSCPEGFKEECVTYDVIYEQRIDIDAIWGLTGPKESEKIEVQVCTCVPDSTSDTGTSPTEPTDTEPADFSASWGW